MKNFTYFRPTTPEQAVGLLENRWGNTELLAGGTDLLDLLKEYVAQPGRVVSLGNINGGPQIRNMGTLGGNLCQRNRCWYFRDEHTPCLIKGGDRCYAINGENKYHAVFTAGHPCVIVHPSTLAPVLIALGATAEVLGPRGRQTVELAKFFRAPTRDNSREHNLASNEVVLAVNNPVRNLASASY